MRMKGSHVLFPHVTIPSSKYFTNKLIVPIVYRFHFEAWKLGTNYILTYYNNIDIFKLDI